MGSGDWNDGMNLVGVKGEGESVWLAFFLYFVLKQFGPLTRMRGDGAFGDLCAEEAKRLRQKIESEAWDGQWYLRAYCDDGTVLGSSQNKECKIDSTVQSWSVLSGAGSPERSKQAMLSLARVLIDPQNDLIKLLDPPFDKSTLEPGYIKGYVPGVRENGGQYTHAAVWAVMAFAMMGESQRVKELLSMINPINHGSTREKIDRYLVEPYVMAADIYGSEPHTGRGGWTWYTGSASWMYRLIVESVLGLHLKVNTLTVNPCIPPEWKTFKIHYRFRETVYHIAFDQVKPGGEIRITVDGVEREDRSVALIDDQQEHFAEIVIGS
jgi:cellobiose phosphorylase